MKNSFINVKSSRVFRGGSWYSSGDNVRVARRDRFAPDDPSPEHVGFRCVVRPKELEGNGN